MGCALCYYIPLQSSAACRQGRGSRGALSVCSMVVKAWLLGANTVAPEPAAGSAF